GDPQLAADVVNSAARHFLNLVSEVKREEIAESTVYLRQQQEAGERRLQAALADLMEFLQQSRSVQELAAEIEAKTALLAAYKANMLELNVAQKRDLAQQEAIRKQLEQTPLRLTKESSVLEDDYLRAILEALGSKAELDPGLLKIVEEEINPVYLELSLRQAEIAVEIEKNAGNIKGIQTAISQLEEELRNLQMEHAEKRVAYEELQRQVDLHKAVYQTFSDRLAAVEMSESVQAGQLAVSVVSPAVPPSAPSGPSKMLNIAIALVLGLMTGVFLAFFLHYWQESGSEKITETKAS
ncbi:MAG TPA: hypothetical protein GX697_03195, partial [Firmicutes bacterium]|nr:hypothetical protein [Bacillota bacterium]